MPEGEKADVAAGNCDFLVVERFLRLSAGHEQGEILFTETGFQATRSEKFIRISR